MENKKQGLEESANFFPVLWSTYEVSENDVLARFYKEHQSSGYGPSKLMLSLFNSILHHRMVLFCLEPLLAIKLYESDKAWGLKTKVGIRDLNSTIDIMIKNGSVSLVHEKVGNKPAVYRVVCEDMLNEIKQTELEFNDNKKAIYSYLNGFE